MDNFKYNTGAIARAPFEDGTFGRVHNFVWTLPLSVYARAVLAWADSRPSDWIPRVDNIQGTFGWDDKQWRRVRKELESIGCIKSEHRRDLKSEKSVHTLNIDLTVLPTVAPEPPARNGGSRARSAKNGGSREPPEMGGSREPPDVAGLTTTSEPRLNNHHKVGGGQEDCDQGRSALAPSGSGAGFRLGARLADLLTGDEQRRVNTAGAGASESQLVAAEVVIRSNVASGKAESPVAFAVALGKLAVRGGVGAPTAKQGVPPVSTEVDPWLAREAFVGRYVQHPDGVLIVEPGARCMRFIGRSKYAGSVLVGSNLLSLWERIENGELGEPTLDPPSSATAPA